MAGRGGGPSAMAAGGLGLIASGVGACGWDGNL